MKAIIILLLIVGTVSVIANPVSKPENSSNDTEPPLPEVEVELELEDTTLNKSDPEPIKVQVMSEEISPEPAKEPMKMQVMSEEILPEPAKEPIKVQVFSEEILPQPATGEDTTKYSDGEVDIVIEESVTPLEEVISDDQNEIKIDDDDYLYPGNQLIDNILADRIKDEIMETAAGFAPPPFLRKRRPQPARRRFAIRRHYQRYPYAPYRRLPYYNPYYTFYRPSSLRFY